MVQCEVLCTSLFSSSSSSETVIKQVSNLSEELINDVNNEYSNRDIDLIESLDIIKDVSSADWPEKMKAYKKLPLEHRIDFQLLMLGTQDASSFLLENWRPLSFLRNTASHQSISLKTTQNQVSKSWIKLPAGEDINYFVEKSKKLLRLCKEAYVNNYKYTRVSKSNKHNQATNSLGDFMKDIDIESSS